MFGGHGPTREHVRASHALELLGQRAKVLLAMLGSKGLVPAGRGVNPLVSWMNPLRTVLDPLALDRPHPGHSLGWTCTRDRSLQTMVPVESERTDVSPLTGRRTADARIRPLVTDTTPTPGSVTPAREIADAVPSLSATERCP